jgi:hypothetical protein
MMTRRSHDDAARQPRVTGALNTTGRAVLNNGWRWSIRGDMTYTGSTCTGSSATSTTTC